MENWREAGFGLYVHWPFCEAKCPYCDFNSHVSDAVDHDRWRSALVADLRRQAEQVPDRVLSSIFFGGGTPSRMHPDTVAAVIEETRRLWPTVNDLEVSLEANPTSVEAARFSAFADAGVTRVSIGLQAMRDDDLRKLGRTHSVAQALAALEIARAQFERVSFDLIYARQEQTMADWRVELNEALMLKPDHISLYQLTIEPGTVFARRAIAGKLAGLPNEDQIADMYLETNDILSAHGLHAYEVSNHARSEAACRHNLIYWRSGDWLGVGPGAHGRYGFKSDRKGTVSYREPDAWLNAVETRGHGIESTELGTETGHADEYLLSSLRLAEGLDLKRLSSLGIEIPQGAIQDIVDEGLVSTSSKKVMPTDRGRALADSIIAYFAARSVPARDSASQS